MLLQFTNRWQNVYFVSLPDEICAQHVYMIFHPTHVRVKEIRNHPGERPVGQNVRREGAQITHAIDMGVMLLGDVPGDQT